MIKIGTKKDLNKIINILPSKIYSKCIELITVLDNEYGIKRTIDTDMGGSIAIIENIKDLEILKDTHYLDVYRDIVEYIEEITDKDITYYSILYMLSSDYGINIVVKENLLPKRLLNIMED